MTFDEILSRATGQLAQEQRIAYRTLQRRDALNDEDIADIKTELVDAKALAQDENGRVLVWVGHPHNSPAPGSDLAIAESLTKYELTFPLLGLN